MKIEPFLDEEGKSALKAVRSVIAPLWDPRGDSEWRPPELDQRITWALSKAKSKYVVAILADKKDSWASRKAGELGRNYPDSIVWTTPGEAQSSYPGVECAPHATSRVIKPGVSIGHGRFRAGTLGCIVEVHGEGRDYKCAVTAAHVVALNDSVELGNLIYSPGKPEIGSALTRGDAIGRLQNTVDLIPFYSTDPSAGEDIYQSIDIALVNIEECRRPIPDFNQVPHPANPKQKVLRIKSVIKEIDLPNILLKNVYKFGRTTGFTEGILVHVMIMHRQLKLPNNKFYLYRELLAVKSTKNGKPFSLHGDSGAMVYTAKGQLVGFVIGADNEITLCCAAERSLEAMKAHVRGT